MCKKCTLLLVVVSICVFAMSGCTENMVEKEEYDKIVTELNEVSEKSSDLEKEIVNLTDENKELKTENKKLSEELEKLKNETSVWFDLSEEQKTQLTEEVEQKRAEEEEAKRLEEAKKQTENAIINATKEQFGDENFISVNYVPWNNFVLIKAKGDSAKPIINDVFNTLKALKDIPDLTIDFNIVSPVIYTDGSKDESIVLKASYSYGTRNSIVWDRVLWENIGLLADEWWESPAFTNDLENNRFY